MKAWALVGIMALLLAGCGTASATLPPPGTVLNEGDYATETWITGLVYVNNAFVGCNRISEGLRLHNGAGPHSTTQRTAIGTDPGETGVDVPLRAPLADNSVDSVQELTSDNPADTLKATIYNRDAQTIRIEGFAPGASRTISLTYAAWNRIVLEYTVVTDTIKGYALPPTDAKDWVLFTDSIIMAPGGTVNIPVRFAIPNEYKGKIPLRWEFGIRASDSNQGMINQGVLSTWLVTMR